jgi:hypothetical protein
MMRENRHLFDVFAIGNVGRRKVHEIWKKDRAALYGIARINYDGTFSSWERGGRTLAATKAISANILRSQRFTDIEIVKVRAAVP